MFVRPHALGVAERCEMLICRVFFFMPSFVPTAPLVVAQRARLCFLITVCTISSRKVLGSIIDRLNKREGEI